MRMMRTPGICAMEASSTDLQRSSDAGRAHDAPMQHPVDDEVMDIDMSARELGGQVRPLHLFADHAIGRRAAQRGFRIELQGEATISDQRGEADACAACARTHFAVHGVEITCRQSQPLRRQVDQGGTCRRRCPTNLHAALCDAGAAPRRSLIGRQRRVAFHQMNAIDGDAELFRENLPEGDAQARSDVDLAAEQRHRSIAVDGEECVDLIIRERAAARRVAGQRGLAERRRRHRNDHKRAACLQELAPGRNDRHGHALPAARRTAFTIRSWVPHRQRLAASASFIFAASGLASRASKAALVMIMPFEQ